MHPDWSAAVAIPRHPHRAAAPRSVSRCIGAWPNALDGGDCRAGQIADSCAAHRAARTRLSLPVTLRWVFPLVALPSGAPNVAREPESALRVCTATYRIGRSALSPARETLSIRAELILELAAFVCVGVGRLSSDHVQSPLQRRIRGRPWTSIALAEHRVLPARGAAAGSHFVRRAAHPENGIEDDLHPPPRRSVSWLPRNGKPLRDASYPRAPCFPLSTPLFVRTRTLRPGLGAQFASPLRGAGYMRSWCVSLSRGLAHCDVL